MTWKAEPQWEKRWCRSCGKTKPREAFSDGWRQRCIECSFCLGGCGRVVTKRKTCSQECYEKVRAQALAKAAEARKASRRPLPTRRRCCGCHIIKPIEEFRVERYDPDTGEILRRAYQCGPCKRAYQRLTYASNPESRQKAQERARRFHLRAKERKARDPEYAAVMAERQRVSKRNRKMGLPDRRFANDSPPRGPMPRLPAAPLAHLVEHIVMREQARLENFETAEQAKKSRDQICKNYGCDARDLYAWSHGERQTVQFDVADRVLLATGLNWYDVWPEEDFPKVAEFMEGA